MAVPDALLNLREKSGHGVLSTSQTSTTLRHNVADALLNLREKNGHEIPSSFLLFFIFSLTCEVITIRSN